MHLRNKRDDWLVFGPGKLWRARHDSLSHNLMTITIGYDLGAVTRESSDRQQLPTYSLIGAACSEIKQSRIKLNPGISWVSLN